MRQRASQSATYTGNMKYSAKDGSVEWKSSLPDSDWAELDLPLNLIMDAGNFRTGWRKLKPGDVGFRWHAEAYSGKWPAEPEENQGYDREDKPWSKAMSFLVTGKNVDNEVVEFAASSKLLMSSLDDMLDAFEDAGGGPGKAAKVVLAKNNKIKTKNGSFYAPEFEVKEVIDREDFFAGMDIAAPDALWSEPGQAAPTVQPQVAASKAAPASSSDDDGDFF